MSVTEKLVTISRLKALLDAYGASPEHWPEEERAAATALIETSADAHSLMEQAAALDRLLDDIPEPEVCAALTSRVRSLALPVATHRAGGFFAWLAARPSRRTGLGWQGAAAMAGVLGIVAGVGISPLVFDRVFDRAGQPQVAAATPVPVENGYAAAVSDGTETGIASLSPNVNAISLAGDDITVGLGDTSAAGQSEAGDFTVAGIPLY